MLSNYCNSIMFSLVFMNSDCEIFKFMNLVMLTTPQFCYRPSHPLFLVIAMSYEVAPSLKGYDCQFVDPPPDDLICLICLSVARYPQQINCCGKVICKACLDEHKQYSYANCPQCRKVISSFADKRGISQNNNIM